MKKLSCLRVIALVLMLSMCLGLAACAGDNADENNQGSESSSNSENNNENNNENKLTGDEALFASLKDAFNATKTYEGAISCNATQAQGNKSGEENDKMLASIDFSFDSATSRYFQKTNVDYGEGNKYNIVFKGFVQSEKFYTYESYDYGESTEENYSLHPNSESIIDDISDAHPSSILPQVAEGLFLVNNFAELKSSFDSTHKKLLENETAYMKSEGSLADGETLTLSPTVSITEKDGVITLTVSSAVTASSIKDGDYQTKNLVGSVVRSVSAKDGKIVSCKVSFTAVGDEIYEEKTTSQEISFDIDYNFSYSFNEAAYNAISVTLPSNPDDITVVKEEKTITFVILGDENEYNFSEDTTPKSFFDMISDEVAYWYTASMSGSSMGGNSSVQVKGFYKDDKFTQKIDENISAADLLAIDTIYVELKIPDGYALVQESTDTENAFSLAYQVVTFDMFGAEYSYSENSMLYDVNVKPSITLEYTPERDESHKVLVNGVETTAEALTLESGKIYVIEYVAVIQDKDLGLSHVFPLF